MTDQQLEEYSERVEPLRVTYRARLLAFEEKAAAGIRRDLVGLGGVHGDVVAFVESRWTRWLDANIALLDRQYQRDAAHIREEVVAT